MTADLRGKTALVTGVGRAGQIGYAVARGLGRAGAKVLVAGRSDSEPRDRAAELTAEGIAAQAVAADLSDPAGAQRAVAAATAAFGGLDVVINAAGGLIYFGDFLKLSADAFERELSANVKTTLYVCQAAIPVLLARGGGAIVNFASIAVQRALPQMVSYSAAKWAVAGITRALAREYRDANIRVNAVAPATVRTAANLAQLKPDAKTRLVELEDLVRAVLFLASDEALAVTGQILPVTGADV